MVTILPQEQGLGELLGGGLSAGVQTGLSGLIQQHKQTQKQQKTGSALAQLLGKPEMAEQFGNIPIEMQQILGKEMLTQAGKAGQGMTEYQRGKLDISKAKEEREKFKATGLMSPEEGEKILYSIGEMKKLVKYTGSTQVPFMKGFSAGPHGLNREGLQKREEFNSYVSDLVSYVREQESRGNINKETFKDLMKRVPDINKPVRQNIGNLIAFEKRVKNSMNLSQKKYDKINSYSKTATNPKTGQKLGLSASGKWEIIK